MKLRLVPRDKVVATAKHTAKGGHMIYFGAAALGAHGVYAAAAGVIFVILLAGMLFHFDME